MKITENFSREEFNCKDGTAYPCKWIDERLHPLCEALEKIRTKVGRPLKITSGYRTPAHNSKQSGAAPKSQHMVGRAVDFYVVTKSGEKPISGSKLYSIIEEMIQKKEIPNGGLGKYKNMPRIVHYDLGPAGRRWSK